MKKPLAKKIKKGDYSQPFYFGTYNRLRVRATDPARVVLRALYKKLTVEARTRANRTGRHAIARAILCNHEKSKTLFLQVTK
jgi:hypothetical protein